MKKKFLQGQKCLLSFVLAMVMVATLLPMSAFADEENATGQNPVVEASEIAGYAVYFSDEEKEDYTPVPFEYWEEAMEQYGFTEANCIFS